MSFFVSFLWLSTLLVAHASSPLLKKLQEQAQTVTETCSTQRTSEWNDAVAIRYQTYKKELGFLPNECLLAPLMPFNASGPSGGGSRPSFTEPLRQLFRTLFNDKSKNIKTFFDAPCGDWVWMQMVDLSGVTYLGGDITSVTIEENKRCFAKENVGFTVFDLTCNKIPDVDLMLTRDVLFHLEPDVVMQILKKISESNVRYWISTTYTYPNARNPFDNHKAYGEVKRENSTIGYRDINLFDAPYCLPEPILKIKEGGRERYEALWQLPFKVGDCSHIKGELVKGEHKGEHKVEHMRGKHAKGKHNKAQN